MKKRPTDKSQSSAEHQANYNPTPQQDGKQHELFERPAINPRWPTPGTKAFEALARMLAGERLTQPSFGFHGWRLAAYAKELQYLGWPICKGEVAAPHKTTKPIREYYFSPETIACARLAREANQ